MRPALRRVLGAGLDPGHLFIFQGTFYIIASVSTKEVNSTWWLGLMVGILEVLLLVWASQQYRPVRGALL